MKVLPGFWIFLISLLSFAASAKDGSEVLGPQRSDLHKACGIQQVMHLSFASQAEKSFDFSHTPSLIWVEYFQKLQGEMGPGNTYKFGRPIRITRANGQVLEGTLYPNSPLGGSIQDLKGRFHFFTVAEHSESTFQLADHGMLFKPIEMIPVMEALPKDLNVIDQIEKQMPNGSHYLVINPNGSLEYYSGTLTIEKDATGNRLLKLKNGNHTATLEEKYLDPYASYYISTVPAPHASAVHLKNLPSFSNLQDRFQQERKHLVERWKDTGIQFDDPQFYQY